MTRMKITSLDNKKIKQLCTLHTKKGRDQAQAFLIENEHLIEEALKAGWVKTMIVLEGDSREFEDIIEVTEAVMKKLSQNVSLPKVMAVCTMKKNKRHSGSRVLLCDGIQDPGNMGTMIRTAVSFGFDEVICSPDCVDVYNDKTVRSTQGALFAIPIQTQRMDKAIQELHDENFHVVATSLHQAHPLSECEPKEKMALVLGNEGQGVRQETIACCDESVIIEMNQFESLNVAIAAGILMYRFRK